MTQNQLYHRGVQRTSCEGTFSSNAKLGLWHSQVTKELVASLNTENELGQANRKLENRWRDLYEENIGTGTSVVTLKKIYYYYGGKIKKKTHTQKTPPENRLNFLS